MNSKFWKIWTISKNTFQNNFQNAYVFWGIGISIARELFKILLEQLKEWGVVITCSVKLEFTENLGSVLLHHLENLIFSKQHGHTLIWGGAPSLTLVPSSAWQIAPTRPPTESQNRQNIFWRNFWECFFFSPPSWGVAKVSPHPQTPLVIWKNQPPQSGPIITYEYIHEICDWILS